MSDADLREKEENPALATASDAEIAEMAQSGGKSDSDQVGDGYTGNGQKTRRFRLSRKQKAVGGGVSILLTGGVFSVLSVSSGPFQFIHMAQLMQRFHFQSVEDSGDGRMLKLYKFAKNYKGGTPENTRLGVLGRKIADHIDAKYDEIGFKKSFTDSGLSAGTYEGMYLDFEKFAENAKNGEGFKGLTQDEAMAKFKEDFGIEVGLKDDKPFISHESDFLGGYFKNKRLNAFAAEEAGLNKVSGTISTRVMGKRDGVTWHPIRRLDAKIIGAADEGLSKFGAWLAEQRARIKGQEVDGVTLTGEEGDKNEDGTPKNPDEDLKNGEGAEKGNSFNDEIKGGIDPNTGELNPEKVSGPIKQLTQSTEGQVAIAGAAVVGIACAVKGIADAADALKHDMVILPMIRMAMQAVALGNQVMNGGDLDLEQLGFFSRSLYREGDGSWAGAKSIQAELGQEQTGQDIADDVNPAQIKKGTMFSQIINGIPGLGIVCSKAESGAGKALMFGISLLTPVGTLAGYAATSSPLFKSAISGLIKWIAGGPVPAIVFGATFGNFVNFGSFYASNESAVSMGGQELDPVQTSELKRFENDALQKDIENRSFAERMFDVYSPDSLAGRVIDATPANPDATTVASFMANLVSPAKILSIIKTPFMHRTFAESTYDYGAPKVGFSLKDLNDDTYGDPYENSDKVKELLAGDKGDEYIKQAKECFGVEISADGNLKSDLRTKIDPTSKDYEKNCTKKNDHSPEWTRIRFFVLDMKTAEASACFIGDEDSCYDSGFGAKTGADPTADKPTTNNIVAGDTSNLKCEAGTDNGIGDGYKEGKLYKIRLCNVQGTVVNAQIAKQVDQMYNAARAQGLSLSGGGFRTMEQQKAARVRNHCPDVYTSPASSCPTPTAIPGYSNHQMGLAIDINCSGVLIPNTGTSGNRKTSPNNACWNWLNTNASKYGLQQLRTEAWHWSVDGS